VSIATPLAVSLPAIRAGRPGFYPDQAIHAEFAARRLRLAFSALDETGLLFSVSSQDRCIWFGGGRCSYVPQNNATAATLAADKSFTARILSETGIANLGGDYVFLSGRYRAHRPPGHEREDAVAMLRALGGRGFVKPLSGSRGDLAQPIHSEEALAHYLDHAASVCDAILIQPIVSGDEFRILVIDDDVLYSARKQPPVITGDGVTPLADLIARHRETLLAHGIASVSHDAPDLARVPAAGETIALPGRSNRSAGGTMVFEEPPAAAKALAIAAVRALGLRVGGVDLFCDVDGRSGDHRIIEINANPSVRFLEDSGRDDLILALWRHTFGAMGLLDV
jgi:D-alanine-D-alanine ligase-like ATP-grasp enzyme